MIFATESFIGIYIFIVLPFFDYFMKFILVLKIYSGENKTIANYDIYKTSLIWKNGSAKAMWLDKELESEAALEDM